MFSISRYLTTPIAKPLGVPPQLLDHGKVHNVKSPYSYWFAGLALLIALIGIVALGILAAEYTRPTDCSLDFYVHDNKDYLVGVRPQSMMSSILLDLQTGRVSPFPNASRDLPSFVSSLYLSQRGDRWFLCTIQDSRDVIVKYGNLVEQKPITRKVVKDFAVRLRNCQPMGELVVRWHDDGLELWDIDAMKRLDHVSVLPSTDCYLKRIETTNRFLAVDTFNKRVALIKVEDARIHLISEWSAAYVASLGVNEEADDRIVSIGSDLATYEIRQIADGTVESTFSFPTTSNQASQSWYANKGFINNQAGAFINPRTGGELPIEQGTQICARDAKRGWLIVRTRSNRESFDVIDEKTGGLIRSFPGGPQRRCALLSTGELAIAENFHVRIHDLATGDLHRIVDPFRYGTWLNAICTVLFGIWCIAWIVVSSQIKLPAWIDALCIAAPPCAYFLYRSRCSAEIDNETGLFVYLGIFGSVMTMISLWVCIGRKRFLWRCTPYFVLLGATLFLIHRSVNSSLIREELLPATALVLVTTTLLCWGFRMMGIRLGQPLVASSDPEVLDDPAGGGIALRDMILLMVGLAIFFGFFQNIPLSTWHTVFTNKGPGTGMMVAMILSLCVTFVIVNLVLISASAWTSFSTRSLVARWLPWGGIAIVMCLVSDHPAVPYAISFSMVMIVALHAYRIRGWRFLTKPQRHAES